MLDQACVLRGSSAVGSIPSVASAAATGCQLHLVGERDRGDEQGALRVVREAARRARERSLERRTRRDRLGQRLGPSSCAGVSRRRTSTRASGLPPVASHSRRATSSLGAGFPAAASEPPRVVELERREHELVDAGRLTALGAAVARGEEEDDRVGHEPLRREEQRVARGGSRATARRRRRRAAAACPRRSRGH